MKIKVFFLLASALLINFSCKKSETTEEPKPTNPTTVKLLTKATASNGTVTTYSYDSKKRLISTISSASASSEVNYEYNDRDELLKRTTGGVANFANRTEYIPTYGEAGKIRSVLMKAYRNGSVDNEKRFDYVYSNSAQVIAVKQYYGTILEVTFTLNYAGENCIKWISDDPTFGFYREYTYDDKKTPHYNSNAGFLLGLLTGPFPIHNILSTKTTFTYAANSPAPQTSTTTYTYDADGFPKTATTGSNVVTYTYTDL